MVVLRNQIMTCPVCASYNLKLTKVKFGDPKLKCYECEYIQKLTLPKVNTKKEETIAKLKKVILLQHPPNVVKLPTRVSTTELKKLIPYPYATVSIHRTVQK